MNLQNSHQSLAGLMMNGGQDMVVGQRSSVMGRFARHALGKGYLKPRQLLCPWQANFPDKQR